MHLHFERVEKPNSYCDCNIRTLSWMGKVPDGPLQKEEEGWKLNRSQYYSDGWLATGNVRGIVGCTFTTCACRKIPVSDLPTRTNYNLRGHRAEVTIVKWNEPYQKLATCDSSGIIFVWIKYEGRWSIELINDRNTPVTDFSWSHDGRMALICYTDGFVLVGSVTGQRYWSSMLNLESCHTTCGIWTPDDQHVFFGTSKGHVIVIQVNGTVVSQVTVRDGVSIASMSWSCEKFKMEDTDESSNEGKRGMEYVLAVCFADGVVYLMKNYDDIFPAVIASRLESVKMEWSNNGDVLAVAGHKRKATAGPAVANDIWKRQPAAPSSSSGSSFSSALNESHSIPECNTRQKNGSCSSHANKINQPAAVTASTTAPLFINSINFYTVSGILRFRVNINFLLHPITALTWGHNDKRIFVATGAVLHIAWISKKVPSLQLLSRLSVFKLLPDESSADQLKLPSRIQALISSLFGRTLRCFLPEMNHLRDFVSKPPIGNVRLHCTLIRHDDDLVGGSTTYVLYLEYLGGLVPILKGKRASKLKPEFVIFDPQVEPAEERMNQKSVKDAASTHSAPQSRSTTPILSRRKTTSHSSSNQLYWNSRSTPASGTESESDDSSCMTDSYGHVYSLPSPIMRRKCRRKRRGAAQPDSDPTQATGLNLAPDHPVGAEIPAAVNNANPAANRSNNGNNNVEGNNRTPAPDAASTEVLKPESTYMDEMPELERLILVTSNIWGTKFKILGLSSLMPSCLGTITYRTSVLHLQPRQMTLQIKELGSRRCSTRSDLKLCSPAEEMGTFERDDGGDRTTGSPADFADSYVPIAPMTPRKNIRGQRRTISPDRKRRLHHFSSNSRQHEDGQGMISALNEDILTLQINADSNCVTMELHQLPSSNSSFHSLSQSHYSAHHRSHPALRPASSQTSFHELNAEHPQPYFQYVNQTHLERKKSLFSPIDDNRPDDLIAHMARQLAAEYTLTQLTTSPGPQQPIPHRQITVPALAPNDNHPFLSAASSSPNFPTTAAAFSADITAIMSPDSYYQSVREAGEQQPFSSNNAHDQHSYVQSEQQHVSTVSFPAYVSTPEITNLQTNVHRDNSCEIGGESSRRSRSMLRANNNCSSASADLAPYLSDDCDRESSILRSPIISTGRPLSSDRMKGHFRQRLYRQQLLQQINHKQAVLISSPSHIPAALTSHIPAAQLTGCSSSSATVAATSSGQTRSADESSFTSGGERSIFSCPQEIMKFADEHDDGIMKAGRSADVCSSHQATSPLLPSSSSPLSFPTSSALNAIECESLISSCKTNTIGSPINPHSSGSSGMDHTDFLNVRTRSGSTPSTDVPRLTLRPFSQKSVSGLSFDQALELLQQHHHAKRRADCAASKFNCTELDGIDACPMDECLSCGCENDCSQKVDVASHVWNQKAELGHFDQPLPERPAYRSESGYNSNCNQISGSNIFSTPVHRPNRNRLAEYKYENLISRESVLSVTAVPSRVHGDVQLSSGLMEILPDSDRMDRRQLQKSHLQLQLHHPPSDLRPSPGFTSDAEIMPHMPGFNFGLLRSSSTNSSSPSDARIRSLPASPAQRRRAFGRSILNSPLMLRKVLKQK